MPGPIQHHLASGIHPGAFVQSSAPVTTDVQDGVLWIDTSSGPPYQLKMWDQTGAVWQAVGSVAGTSTGSAVDSTGHLHTTCLIFLSYAASICNTSADVVTIQTPGAYFEFTTNKIVLPGGHYFEVV